MLISKQGEVYCFKDISQIYRTKVECAGQCMIDPSCDTFNYVSNVCRLLKSDLLFKDGTPQTEVYMEISLSAGHQNDL